MEFWGVEVKPGQSLKVQPEFCKLIHISQASLGEVKDVKGAKNVPLRLKIDGKDLVIGSLAAEDRTQILFDLVFEKEFELSHGWKNGSVYFLGYIADDPVSDGDDFSDLSGSEDEDELVPATENGHAEPKLEDTKAAKATKKETFVAKPVESGSDEDEDEDDSDSDDEDDEVDSEDDDMESSEEELPQKEQPTKKRPAESPKMTAPGKKAKPNQKGSPFAGKGAGKPQQGGANKFNKGQKGKAGGQRR